MWLREAVTRCSPVSQSSHEWKPQREDHRGDDDAHEAHLSGRAPVSPYTVGKELGHGGTSMVERVYSHLGQVRHRSDVVEYRLEHHREALGDRLTALEKATI